MGLFPTMQIEAGFILSNLVCDEILLTSHSPYRGHALYIGPLYEYSMLLVNVAVDFFHYCFDKFGGIILLKGLMQVHNVTHPSSWGEMQYDGTCILELQAHSHDVHCSHFQENLYIVINAGCHGFGKVQESLARWNPA